MPEPGPARWLKAKVFILPSLAPDCRLDPLARSPRRARPATTKERRRGRSQLHHHRGSLLEESVQERATQVGGRFHGVEPHVPESPQEFPEDPSGLGAESRPDAPEILQELLEIGRAHV